MPATIGNYRIVQLIGEGGMGMVYEAEQQQPKRAVAIKVIRGGQFVNEVLVKMFQREAQSLARLKHPAIASIFESGRTEDGQHFFAMELVRGEPLNEWLSRRDHGDGLAAGELKLRLALFLKICDAVAYAHQRGVIHRDLKPANILVLDSRSDNGGTRPDDAPEIKILDFGLARITDTDLGMSTMTDVGTIQGTIQYMSPEQVRANPDDIDLRTDVYSLGVILYEMLTGGNPYDMEGANLYKAAQIICESPPIALAKSWTGAKKPDRDIETIISKTLEKESGRRYQSVFALAEDVRRHLQNHPILARPPSTVYQLRKMIARHKLVFAFSFALLVLLAGFAVTMAVQAGRIARERDRANQEAEAARQVSGFLTELFEVSDPGEALGNKITAREILDRGANRIRRELKNQPQIQGRLMNTMGRVYWSLGLYDQARPLLEEALGILKQDLSEDDPDVADSLDNLGNLFLRTGDYDVSRPLFEKALDIRERNLGPGHPMVADVLNNLGNLLLETGDYQGAREANERALEIRRSALGEDNPAVAKSLNNLAILARRTGDYERAKDLYEQALRILEGTYGPEHPGVAQGLNNLGSLYKQIGNYAAARSYFERSLEIRAKVLGPDHPDLARSLNNLANLLEATGEYDEARKLHQRALKIREEGLGPEHPAVAQSLNNLGKLYISAGEYETAKPLLERARAIQEKSLDPAHPKVLASIYNLACLSARRGRRAEALAYLQTAYDRGFANRAIFEDSDLASLHGDPDFERLVAGVRGRLEADRDASP